MCSPICCRVKIFRTDKVEQVKTTSIGNNKWKMAIIKMRHLREIMLNCWDLSKSRQSMIRLEVKYSSARIETEKGLANNIESDHIMIRGNFGSIRIDKGFCRMRYLTIKKFLIF